MMDWVAIGLTLRLAGCAALVLLVIGLRFRTGWLHALAGRVFVEAIVALPLVLPPTVLGFYLLSPSGHEAPWDKGSRD